MGDFAAGEGNGEAEARLLAFCRRFVADAAADAWAQHAAAAGRTTDGGHALTPEGYSWDQVRFHNVLPHEQCQVKTDLLPYSICTPSGG